MRWKLLIFFFLLSLMRPDLFIYVYIIAGISDEFTAMGDLKYAKKL